MAIRLRTVNGMRVALCAAETDAEPGDLYLDDGDHYALAAKFSRDWAGQVAGWAYPEEWAAMDTQKKRDAVAELARWQMIGARCCLSAHAIARGIHQHQAKSGKQARRGTITGESRDGTMWLVVWDELQTPQVYHKSFIATVSREAQPDNRSAT